MFFLGLSRNCIVATHLITVNYVFNSDAGKLHGCVSGNREVEWVDEHVNKTAGWRFVCDANEHITLFINGVYLKVHWGIKWEAGKLIGWVSGQP